jgi:hypothetical protein
MMHKETRMAEFIPHPGVSVSASMEFLWALVQTRLYDVVCLMQTCTSVGN